MKTKSKVIILTAVAFFTVFATYSFNINQPKNIYKNNLTVSQDCKCSTCNGTGSCGYCNGGSYKCAVCNGTGYKGTDNEGNKLDCNSCNGSGSIPCRACFETGKCGTCKGSGEKPCQK